MRREPVTRTKEKRPALAMGINSNARIDHQILLSELYLASLTLNHDGSIRTRHKVPLDCIHFMRKLIFECKVDRATLRKEFAPQQHHNSHMVDHTLQAIVEDLGGMIDVLGTVFIKVVLCNRARSMEAWSIATIWAGGRLVGRRRRAAGLTHTSRPRCIILISHMLQLR